MRRRTSIAGWVLTLGALVACDDGPTSATGTGGSSTSTSTSATSASTSGASTTGASTMGSTTSSSGASSTASSSSTGAGGAPVDTFDCAAPAGAVGPLILTEVANGLGTPVQAISAPDDPDRLYIVEKSGRIRILDQGVLLPTPFFDISPNVMDSGEEGLLGLAFHPDYATNGRFFVHYSAKGNADNVVQEYHRSDANHLVTDAGPVKLVMRHPTSAVNHNGGAVEFGPDGFLYVSMGDGGDSNDLQCDAQRYMGGDPVTSGENLFGKISRFDVEAPCDATGCPAAPGNPMGHKAFHVGLRNPWRITFDLCAPHDLYIADVGQDLYEEIDVVPLGVPANFGWPYREGAHDFPNTCPVQPPPADLVAPTLEYSHGQGRCSISGGYVYRSSAIPALRGAYFYGDYCSGEVFYRFPGAPPVTANVNPGLGLDAFGQDGRGNVYVLHTTGRVLRVDSL